MTQRGSDASRKKSQALAPSASDLVVHDSMPVMFDRINYDLWLDSGIKNADALSDMLKPYDARMMRRYPVSTRLNQAQNDDAGVRMTVAVASRGDVAWAFWIICSQPSRPVLSSPAPSRPSDKLPCSAWSPILSARKADISCAISTGHIVCYRQ